jgi:3',5'-cyclic AMP phosphodiesterase CpdA
LRTIAHLSDLHFGRVEGTLLELLRRRLLALAPDLVVISGDLTQRARARQFIEARAWLDTLPKPQLVVPGNHDVPLYNVFQRMFHPLANYRRYISDDVAPAYIDEEIAVLGVNTARSLAFKGGRVSETQIARIRATICRLGEEVTKILVTHHPFAVVGRARMALEGLANCGADVLLAGHLHASHVGHIGEHYRVAGFSALTVQAGTALSQRTRGEPNAFNLLRVVPRHIEVDRYVLQRGDFVCSSTAAFDRADGGWLRNAKRHGPH